MNVLVQNRIVCMSVRKLLERENLKVQILEMKKLIVAFYNKQIKI